uniref:Uncharacterized protein n=1 Tax=Octopus bimaculoides TaxID=37653 RepID=A0A0L8GIN2_OCTBM
MRGKEERERERERGNNEGTREEKRMRGFRERFQGEKVVMRAERRRKSEYNRKRVRQGMRDAGRGKKGRDKL